MDRVPVFVTHHAQPHQPNVYLPFYIALLLTTIVSERWVNALEYVLYDISSTQLKAGDCTTPLGNPGNCKSIMLCPDLTRNIPRPLTAAYADYLRTFHCGGFDGLYPKVCCKLAPDTIDTTSNPFKDETPTMPVGKLDNRNADIEYISSHEKLHLLPAADCGPILADKISNGNRTEIFEFPWMVLIQYRTRKGIEFQCDGTLISNRYVLTAAHCVTNLPQDTLELISVRLGEHDLATERDCEQIDDEELCSDPVQDVAVERVIFHEQFNHPRTANDIALIRLIKQVVTSESVQPICLPISDEVQDLLPKRVTITGWGLTENQTKSQQLLQASVPVVSNEDCQVFFRRSLRLSDTQMCAGGERGVDSCKGDSGGPLVYPANIGGAKMVQFGIVSLGTISCTSDNLNPGIYTRVSHYMKWILDNMQE